MYMDNGEKYETPDGLNSVNLKVMYFYRPSRSGPWAGLTYSDNAVGWYCVYLRVVQVLLAELVKKKLILL